MTAIGLMLITIAVIAVTAVLFVFWVVASIFRGVLGIFKPRPPASTPAGLTSTGWQFALNGPVQSCQRPECRHENPAAARFCRRCGSPLIGAILQQTHRRQRPRRQMRAWA